MDQRGQGRDQVDAPVVQDVRGQRVQLQLHALASNLSNFLRTLATPELIKDWSLTSLMKKLIKIGANVVIGVILLIGIVKKNAIMMIDFAIEAKRAQNLNSYDAIFQACRLRYRPIMMTTMAAILGVIPLALSFGNGGEIRRPLGISIVGGLLISQLLTLYTTPVVYLYWIGSASGRSANGGSYFQVCSAIHRQVKAHCSRQARSRGL